MSAVLALLSALLYGVADFLGGLGSRRASLLTVALAAQASGLAGLALVAVWLSHGPPPRADLAWGAASGVFGSVGLALLYRGLATGLASVVAPVTAVCAIAVPVAVDVVAGEVPRPIVLCGIALAMVSVVLLSRGGETAKGASLAVPARKSVAIAIASGVSIGVFLTCLGKTTAASGAWPLFIGRTVGVVFFALACVIARRRLVPPRAARAPALFSGVFDVSANALYLIAVRGGSLGPIATLASLYPASTVALARIVWRERLQPLQSLGLAFVFVAIVMITWPE
jgi:uncharacterized membrane protein